MDLYPLNYSGGGEDFENWFDRTMERYANEEDYPFAVKRRANNRVVGTTTWFCEMVSEHLRLTIGYDPVPCLR